MRELAWPVGSKQSLSPASIFDPSFCGFFNTLTKTQNFKKCLIPTISFKIGYVIRWFSQNLTQILSKMPAENTLENWGFKSLIESLKSIFMSPMTTEKNSDVKGVPFVKGVLLTFETSGSYWESWNFYECSNWGIIWKSRYLGTKIDDGDRDCRL